MLSAQVDANGSLKIVWPRYDADIIALGQAYVAFEGSQPVELRLALPTHAQVVALLGAANTAADIATNSETQRATSAVDYATALAQAKRLLDDALVQLKGRYSKNPAYLKAYNLETRVGARGVMLVARPTTDKGWVNFLSGYATQQAALPEAERISDPSLVEMQRLDGIVSAALADRTSGRTHREIGVQVRSVAATRLLDYLQLAAFALTVTRFDSCVSSELQQWGFNVVAKTAPDQAPLPEPPAV